MSKALIIAVATLFLLAAASAKGNTPLVVQKTMRLDLKTKHEARETSITPEAQAEILREASCFRDMRTAINSSSIAENDRLGFIIASLILLDVDAVGIASKDKSTWVEAKSLSLERRYQDFLPLARNKTAKDILKSIKLQASIARYYKNSIPEIAICGLWSEVNSGAIERDRLEVIFQRFLNSEPLAAWLNDTSMNRAFAGVSKARDLMRPWIKNHNRLMNFSTNFTQELFPAKNYLFSKKLDQRSALLSLAQQW